MKRIYPMAMSTMAGIVLALAVGCGSTKPATFYVMHTPEGLARADTSSDLAVAVGPVSIPGHLERPQVMTVENASELSYSEFHRWAGPLGENVKSTLVENLAMVLGTARVAQYPAGDVLPADFRVAVRITHFEGTLGEEAVLRARWVIHRGEGEQEVLVRMSEYSLPLTQDSYREYVNTQSLLLADLGKDIAATIRELAAE